MIIAKSQKQKSRPDHYEKKVKLAENVKFEDLIKVAVKLYGRDARNLTTQRVQSYNFTVVGKYLAIKPS